MSDKPQQILTSLLILALPWNAISAEVLGKRPGHLRGGPGSVANDQAITKMIWAPGIDDGYVPQGVTVADGSILVSGYKSTNPKVDRGPCRVFQIDPRNGQYTGQFDLPEECGHAGGLAYLGKGLLLVADTRRLYKIDLDKALRDGNSQTALLRAVKLAGELKGSFADSDGASIFIGSSEKDPAKARAFFLPLTVFDRHNGKTIKEDAAIHSFPIAPEGQGAAFDKEGNLWLTFSSSKQGSLKKVDPKSGRVLAQYEMVIGIEDIAFDDEGRLWSVSEAGSIRWSRWPKTFPVVFQVDVGRLR